MVQKQEKKHETNIVQKWNFKLLRIRLHRPCMSLSQIQTSSPPRWRFLSVAALPSPSLCHLLSTCRRWFSQQTIAVSSLQCRSSSSSETRSFSWKVGHPNLPTLQKKKASGKKNKETRNNQVNMFSSCEIHRAITCLVASFWASA